MCAGLLSLNSSATAQSSVNTALTNGLWFTGTSFEPRDVVYIVSGRFTSSRPERIDRTIDLSGTWLVPPFAEAHNHNLGTGVEEWDSDAVRRYLADGVFYVKIPGNLPVTGEMRAHLGLNRPQGIDAVFAQGTLTASGGHPVGLAEENLGRGYFPGETRETLRNRRYFTIDSRADIATVWPLFLAQAPDFAKTGLMFSEEFDKRAAEPSFEGRRGLNPDFLGDLVERAHADGLRISVHVNTAADFHEALVAGADEIAHLPPLNGRNREDVSEIQISPEDAAEAARRGTVVVTTLSIALRAPDAVRQPWQRRQIAALRLLSEAGVPIAIGSDNPADTSVGEAIYIHSLGVLDEAALLRSWTNTTARAIFPDRLIGALRDGYEASFLALDGDPLTDFENVRRIQMWFKQGVLLQP